VVPTANAAPVRRGRISSTRLSFTSVGRSRFEQSSDTFRPANFRGTADILDPLFANPNLALSVKLNIDPQKLCFFA
jgi:hypothetical protein